MDGDLLSLQQRHKAALETIVKLKEGIGMTGQEKSEVSDIDSHDQLKRVEEENLELRQVIDRLSSEFDAAKEIEFIVLELRVKNMEMNESLRVSEEKNKTVANTIETLQADNDQLRNDIIAQLSDKSAKNMEMTESLRVLEEKNKAAVDIIETLKADNDELRNDIIAQQSDKSTATWTSFEAHDDRVVPFENGTSNSTEMSDIEAELQHYKSIVSQMASDRNVFNDQLSKLMGTSGPSQWGLCVATVSAALKNPPQATTNEGALVILESHNSRDHLGDTASDQGVIVTKTDATVASSYAPPPTPLHHPTDEVVEDQIRNLAIENGQLAQRLGGAIAEKEFAMTTLTKLGAKMEELIERNKLLSNTADVKSQHSSRGEVRVRANYQREASWKTHYEFRHEHEHKGCDLYSIG